GHRDPERAGREVGGGDERLVPGEVEHEEREHGEDERREQRGPGAELEPQVLAGDRERGADRLRHPPSPGSRPGTPPASRAAGRCGPTARAPAPPRGWRTPTPPPGGG